MKVAVPLRRAAFRVLLLLRASCVFGPREKHQVLLPVFSHSTAVHSFISDPQFDKVVEVFESLVDLETWFGFSVECFHSALLQIHTPRRRPLRPQLDCDPTEGGMLAAVNLLFVAQSLLEFNFTKQHNHQLRTR